MMTDPSSITSVTEEEISDESDTTESSNSKLSDSISSIMYSSECNTDDKLTTSLVNISISNQNSNCSSKKRLKNRNEDESECFESVSTTSSISGHQSSSINKKSKIHDKKKHKTFHSTSLTKYILQKKLSNKAKTYLPKQDNAEDFGIDDPNNCLFTDFSDTSTVPGFYDNINQCEEDNISIDDDQEDEQQQRPFFPDLNSSMWFQARCFDRYWSHYQFVMEWYRQHVLAVGALSRQMNGIPNAGVNVPEHVPSNTKQMSKKKRVKRAKNRARNRRLAKARLKAAAFQQEATNEVSDSDTENNELEMEITDEMMDFFATSYKHRIERDGKRKQMDDSNRDDKEMLNADLSYCDELPGPREQPGVRRTAEMKTLYGEGAPMIHGMETAIQMTYDKVLDRNRPKLWPNMPLKIKFV